MEDGGQKVEPLDDCRRGQILALPVAKASNCWNRQARELQVCDGIAKQCRDMACPVSVAMSHAFVTVALDQGSEHEGVQGPDVDMTHFAHFDPGFLEPRAAKTGSVKCSDNPLAVDQLADPVLLGPAATHAIRQWPSCCGIFGIFGGLYTVHKTNSEMRRSRHWPRIGPKSLLNFCDGGPSLAVSA